VNKWKKEDNLETCLFCNRDEDYNRNPGAAYICVNCVQVLLMADQKELQLAHQLAVEKGYDRKIRAIVSFLIPEENVNGQRKPGTKKRGRHSDRRRIVRPVRNKKERLRRAQTESATAVL
jgi:hypothetical protein